MPIQIDVHDMLQALRTPRLPSQRRAFSLRNGRFHNVGNTQFARALIGVRALIATSMLSSVFGCPVYATAPNIVIILADDLGFGDLGVNGQNARAAQGLPAIKTPHLDALAVESMSFSRMYTSPTCSPSRASLLTGFSQHHLIQENAGDATGLRPGEEDKTWAATLQQAGYKTGMWGKWHLGGVTSPGASNPAIYNYGELPTQQGFEVVYGTLGGGYHPARLWENDGSGGLKLSPNVYTPQWPGPGPPFQFADDTTANHAAQFISANAATGQPFASYIALQAPHEPFNEISTGEYADMPWPEVQKQYAAMVTNFDRNIGKILKTISDPNNDGNESDSIASNTIVMFASDNGALWSRIDGFDIEFFNSNGSFRGSKGTTLEGGIRTPFFVRWEGVTVPGSVNNDYVGSLADISPTFAELAGEDVPFGLDGRSMVSAITGEGDLAMQRPIVTSSRYLFSGLNQASWCVQLGDWKLIQRMSNMGYELYNIASDPYEATNLANSRADIRAAFIAIAELEGVREEPFFTAGLTTSPQNSYVTQYKYWAGTGGADFSTAGNWSGGTQYTLAGDPEAKYWNTAPGPNWLAKLSNTGLTAKQATVSSNAKVLAMQIEGPGAEMVVSIASNATLQAYNGIRVESGGVLHLNGGKLTGTGVVDVRAGGGIYGSGAIEGFQSILASIPEFNNSKFLQIQVSNGGVIDLFGQTDICSLAINGEFIQTAEGLLHVDVAGFSQVDSISVTGKTTFGGLISVSLADNYTPAIGNVFTFLTAGALSIQDFRLVGEDAAMFAPLITGTSLSLVYTGGQFWADFDFNGVVNGNDLDVWRDNFGKGLFAGDANRDGIVNGNDMLIWQRHFGRNYLSSAAVVPEPSALVAMGALAIVAPWLRGRRRSVEGSRSDQ